jgi:chromosomal replication initiator protein
LERVSTKNVWDRILEHVRATVNDRSFRNWFQPTKFLGEDDSSVQVEVPNEWYAEWLSSNFGEVIRRVLERMDLPSFHVEFVPRGARARAAALKVSRSSKDAGKAKLPLNERYTFDSFVVAPCNQFAHAAAMAVVQKPAEAYNPLYLYGGSGLGKTHLMQAIGNALAQERRMRLLYQTAENFMTDMINAIRFQKQLEFKERFKNVDVLLIDDVEFLKGKESTQDEFFHRFNDLYDAKKQIVITSDVAPRQIEGIEGRLRSRFEWGLIADINPPDLETKIAILRSKADADGIALADDVALLVASHCVSNIRELEGALIRLHAYASMTHKPITLELAHKVLRDVMPEESPAATVESIQKLVANHYGLKVGELKAKTNSHQIAHPRQLAMYLCKKLTSCSLPEIGRRFGGKHHSTVLYAVQKVDRMRSDDSDFDRLVDGLSKQLR